MFQTFAARATMASAAASCSQPPSGRLPSASMAQPTPVDMLRLMELHGEGLRRYTGVEDPSREGNLLVDRTGNLWMATEVDKKGRIVRAMGRVDVTKKPASGAPPPQIPREEVRFQWDPHEEARVFGDPHPSYGDVNATLTEIVGWWGLEKDPLGQELNSPGGFFAAALRASGLAALHLPLPKDATLRDIRGYAMSHGDGLVPWRPGDTGVVPGDWVLLQHGQTWGLVTRVSDDEAPVDIVTSDSLPADFHPEKSYPEQIGEVKGARMYHGLDPAHVRWTWRPSVDVRYP